MPQNDLFRATYVQACNDSRFANVIVFKQTSADGSSNTRSDLATAFLTQIADEFQLACVTNWKDLCIHVRQVGLAGQDYFRALGTHPTGDISDESLPNEICVCIQLKTAKAGRGAWGRLFVSGVAISFEEDNCIASPYVALYAAIGTALEGNITSGGTTFQAGMLDKNGVFWDYDDSKVETALTTQSSR